MWRPPLLKFFPNQGDGVASKVLVNATSVAVAITVLGIVNDAIVKTKKAQRMSRPVQRLLGFLAAFVSGALSYLVLWLLFGIS